MSIEVNHLSKIFGNQKAVDDISFTAKPGEILGFLGPNGAGKSTTMKMITGYYEPTLGTATVCGFDIKDNLLAAQKCIGYLPENNPLYLDMYVKEYLTFVANIHKINNKKTRIDEVIAMTGLQKEQHKIIATLSKGYRQRVGLAQALIHDPQVLILDEPTSGLDMNQLVEIRQLIKDLGESKTVVLSTHIMQEVHALCDRVVIINDGKIVANDNIENLKLEGNSNKELLLSFGNKILNFEKVNSINGVKSYTLNNGIYSVSFDGNEDIRTAIFHLAVKENWVIIEMKLKENNMESVFQNITKK
jgi:ABC-2 type transport system ATP-binding protein